MVPPPMDVRCERCKTEYEFDDARITEAGVTVKCTTCGHVFKVKKKALVVTVPVKPGEVELSAPAPTTAAGERPREWKVRQGSGNVFTFAQYEPPTASARKRRCCGNWPAGFDRSRVPAQRCCSPQRSSKRRRAAPSQGG